MQTGPVVRFLCIFFLSIAAGLSPGQASTNVVPNAGMEIRAMEPEGKPEVTRPALMVSSDIGAEISGPIVRLTVKQTFRNDSDFWSEGLFRFPLPDNAAVDTMVLTVGDRRIVGTIKEKEEAQRTYNEAVRAGKKAALLREYRPNIFATLVGNIPPHGDVTVEIGLQSMAGMEGDTFRWRLPQAITPRYHSEVKATPRVADRFFEGEVFYSADGKANPTSFHASFTASHAIDVIESPSHKLDVTGEGKRLKAELAAGTEPANRDLILNWRYRAGEMPAAMLFRETKGEESYLLGLVLPPRGDAPRAVPPRDVTFVIDISGSMSGRSIMEAKVALLSGLDLMAPEDRFDIIAFESELHPLFGSLRTATPETLHKAKEWVMGLAADGGTEMAPALAAALNQTGEGETLRQILFLTDGAVGDEAALFAQVKAGAGKARLFTVGVGPAPNGWFMRKAAEMGRGIHIQIDDLTKAAEAMKALYADMARPSLTGLALDAQGVDMAPTALPDLYGTRPVVFTLKAGGSGPLVLKGTDGTGRPWQTSLDPASAEKGKGIASLWARRKVEGLMDDAAIRRDIDANRQAIVDIALEHRLLTPYTSFVAVEEKISRPENEGLDRQVAEGNLPEGTSAKQFFGPQTAAGLGLHAYAAFLALLAACFFYALARRRTA